MGSRIAVFGTGYLGTTHAACMADLGHEVLGVDIDPSRLARLRSGEIPFYEPHLVEMLSRNVNSGRLKFTSSYLEAAEFAEAHFIAVPTPQKTGELAADLTQVHDVIETLAPLLTTPSVILGKSTVPVGTSARLGSRMRELAPAGDTVELVWNPEFLREGHAVQDTLHPDRIVLGVDKGRCDRAEGVAREVYGSLLSVGIPFFVTDYETSELVKAAANAFLATKISFINAMAEMCDLTGADVTVLADAIGCDSRIGRRFLDAGVGFGGGCLPKDIRAFMARAGELGADQAFAFLREVDAINMRCRTRAIEMTRAALGGSLIGARVAVLGAAFKPESDDVRDSPALSIAGQIQLQGASVTVYDPVGMDKSRALFPTLEYGASVFDTCRGADATMVLTDWTQFRSLQPADLHNVVGQRIIIDGRNCMNRDQWREAGWDYRGIGVP